MKNNLSKSEKRVFDFLKKTKISSIKIIQKKLNMPRSTLQHAIQIIECYSSYNFNSTFLTLKSTPQFDSHGLWRSGEIRFSKNQTVQNSLPFIIHQSTSGYTTQELVDIMGCRVHNQLSHLLREKMITKFTLKRNAIYLSATELRADKQKLLRQQQYSGIPALRLSSSSKVPIPPGVDAYAIIAILVQCLKTPKESPKAIHFNLHPTHQEISESQVQRVLDFYELKKNGTIEVAHLIGAISTQCKQELESVARLPENANYRFDDVSEETVVKTVSRTVVTKELSKFNATEVVRRAPQNQPVIRSQALNNLVPKGSRYGYDLIVYVGIQSFVKGQRLEDIQRELANQKPSIQIPFSSIHELRSKFLFYLGHMHSLAAPKIKSYLDAMGRPLWLVDGTLEPNTPVFFAVQEALTGIILNCAKMPSEESNEISTLLKQTGQLFGEPRSFLRDLSGAIEQGITMAYPNAIQFICQFHFLRALGVALLKKPQDILVKRMREMKLLLRFKHQRTDQVAELRRQLSDEQCEVILDDILNKRSPIKVLDSQLGREILIACHYWILDYFNDGQRQGYPFDPYSLYLHRRLVKAQTALQSFRAHCATPDLIPVTLVNFEKKLTEYCNDSTISSAATELEEAYTIFNEIRSVMRLTPKGDSPMRDSYNLDNKEQANLEKGLQELKEQFLIRKQESTGSQNSYAIVIKYLESYGAFLPGMDDGPDGRLLISRTTNPLEGYWGCSKKMMRTIHGRQKLTLDFRAFPKEVMLIENLKNPTYIELVMGDIKNLAQKFAEAGQTAGPFSAWKKKNKTLKLGKLAPSTMRSENFIENVTEALDESIKLKAQVA